MNFTKVDIPRQVVPCYSDFPASRVGAAKDARLFYTTEQANLQTAPDHTPGSAACQFYTRDNLQESLKPKHSMSLKGGPDKRSHSGVLSLGLLPSSFFSSEQGKEWESRDKSWDSMTE